MTLYKLRKLLMAPYIWHMRRKESHQTGFMKVCLEQYYYRSAFYRLVQATINNPYILHDAPIRKGSIVVDAGGYDGEWAQNMVARYQPVIYSFEPDPANFPTLQKRFQDNPNVHCFEFGLGKSDCTLTLTQVGMGSTLYAPDDDYRKFVADLGIETSAAEVRVRDIVDVFDELGLTNVDLLKINIEGGEYDVLERLLETGRMKDVHCLMVQFHEWFDNAHWRRLRIRHKLRKTHREVWNYPFIWEQWVKKDAPVDLLKPPLWIEGSKPASGDPDFSFTCSRLVTFQGMLFLTGHYSHATIAPVAWFVVFSTGVVVNRVDAKPGQQLSFDASVPIPPPANFDIKIGFELANGVKLIIDNLRVGEPSSSFDRALSAFSALVKEIGMPAQVLEIGSRGGVNVQHEIIRANLPAGSTSTGLDIEDGDNVDVVGDAHALSRYFAPDSFDIVFSLAVFQQLIMPWKVAVEMNRVMKPGGLAYVMSHQSFPMHDVPRDFWRFSDMAWRGLFNKYTGFEIIDTGLGGTAYIAGDYMGPFTFKMDEASAYLLSSVVIRKIAPALVDWPVDAAELA